MGNDPRQSRQETLDQIVERGQSDRAAGRYIAWHHLTDEQFGRIADDAGVTDSHARIDLSLKIEAAAGWFLADYRSQDRQTPSATEKEAKAAENAARRLLRALKVKEASDPCDGMPPGALRDLLEWAACGEGSGEQEVRSLVAGVGRLQELATKARADAKKDKGPGGHRGKEALNNFIGDLMSVYAETTGRQIGISRRAPYGPTLRFVRACLTGVSENFKEKYPDVARMVRNLTDIGLARKIHERVTAVPCFAL